MSAPRGTDPEMNKELSKIWAQVRERVVQLAGGDEKNIQPLGVDGVLAQLDNAQKKSTESSEKRQGIKTAFNRTLNAISTVGGLAAGAASMVCS